MSTSGSGSSTPPGYTPPPQGSPQPPQTPQNPSSTPGYTPSAAPAGTPPSGTEPTQNLPPRVEAPWNDTAGVWAKFLGPNATPHDVQLFINNMLKFFNNQMEQQQKFARKAAEQMKKVIEGKD